MDEARRNEEVVSLADSQIFRWIDELNGIHDAESSVREIRRQIQQIRRMEYSPQNKRMIRQLYRELDAIQFYPDYLLLIIDREKDYHRACCGFSINGIKYERLLGTNGGIKNSTIVFVSERLADELRKRIENGRNPDKELVPAKLEAYKALTCSASIPVSPPDGLLVVSDCITTFYDNVTYLTDEDTEEPVMEERTHTEITLNGSDGFGLMLPSLAQRWSDELGLDYVMSGANTRNAFEKGMVYTFDFLDFAEKVAGTYEVTDVWGNSVDIRNVELIFTESMLKLWDSYESIEDYLKQCEENHYSFSITKTCPKELESERYTNYQYLQTYPLTDDDIDELIAPTMKEFRDVLGGDWVKTVLFLGGAGLNEESVRHIQSPIVRALIADPSMFDDPYVCRSVFQYIKKRIDEAKVGRIKVHGNYSMASGDPYALCQHIFDLPVTGLLKAGEVYNRYWADAGADRLICFRSPMTCAPNIRGVTSNRSKEAQYWFRYIRTATIMNSWDTACMALNGMDYDGDMVMLTDNPVLMRRFRQLPALMCAQRKAPKKVPTEEDFVRSNIESFGNDIGKITNRATAMFEVQAGFPPDSKEYETLEYRIKSAQLYQQNAIDKAKGIICKPMPRAWYDPRVCSQIEDDEQRTFARSIVADRKPYFMRYIYPSLMRKYNNYIKSTQKNALREFCMDVDQLRAIPEEERTERQTEFLAYYDRFLPVGVGDCVMNRICRRFEDAFSHYVARRSADSAFDYRIMKSTASYTPAQYQAVKNLCDEYNRRLKSYAKFADYERIDTYDAAATLTDIGEEFRKNCAIACPNADALCNLVLDLCYTRSSTKHFAWDMCSEQIIRNLTRRNGGTMTFPIPDDNGDIVFCGRRFSLITRKTGDDHDNHSE